jgi:hypothetical protein
LVLTSNPKIESKVVSKLKNMYESNEWTHFEILLWKFLCIRWEPCVVRGPVDGRFLVWCVIDDVVWTDYRLTIAGAGCGLTSVGAGEEQAWKVVAGEASRCGEYK